MGPKVVCLLGRDHAVAEAADDEQPLARHRGRHGQRRDDAIQAPGFVAEPKRNAADTQAIADYNQRVAAHPQLLTATVPLRDGVSISVKRL